MVARKKRLPFAAGFFAAEILNFAGEVQDPLLERIVALPPLADQAASLGGRDVLAQLRPMMREAVSWICTCPPFCYGDNQAVREEFPLAMDGEMLGEQVSKRLVAIYNFCLLTRAFEKKYLRQPERRTESEFTKAAHSCFDLDDNFLIMLEQMPFGEMDLCAAGGLQTPHGLLSI